MSKQSVKTIRSRRNAIIEILIDKRTQTVEELAQICDVSIPTIRRDLLALEEENQVMRYHGGAKIVDEGYYSAKIPYRNIKEAIAYRAEKYIDDGDTIFINTSSTALLILQFLKNKNVTVITNNVKALYVERDPKVQIILTGGEFRNPKETLVGEFALNNIAQVKADKCFLGCSGISNHLSTSVLQEAAINHAMQMHCVGEVYVLAEASKIGRTHSFVSGDLQRVNCLITDTSVPKEVAKTYQQQNINVIQVEKIRLDEIDDKLK